jgi:hypothetical protein
MIAKPSARRGRNYYGYAQVHEAILVDTKLAYSVTVVAAICPSRLDGVIQPHFRSGVPVKLSTCRKIVSAVKR